MKRVIVLWLVVGSLPAWCEPVSLKFEGVPVVQFLEATYKVVLRKDYVLLPDLVGFDRRISMHVTQVDKARLPGLLAEVLLASGLSARVVGGVVFVGLGQPQATAPGQAAGLDSAQAGTGVSGPRQVEIAEQVEVYRPRFRSVEYLRNQLSSMGSGAGALSVASAVLSPVLPQAKSSQSMNSAAASVSDVLVVAGSQDDVRRKLEFLAQVDSPPPSVLVRAALLEVTRSAEDSRSFGALLKLIGGKLQLSAGLITSASHQARFTSATVDAVLAQVEGDSRFRVISEPRLLVADGKTARLSVGTDVPVRGAVSYDDNGNALQSIEYRSSGVILSITPRIYEEWVSLGVSQQLSSFSGNDTSGIDSPTLFKRELETSVETRPGELVVLAGLDEQKDSASRSGPAWLPGFMQSRSESDSGSQLVLLLEVMRPMAAVGAAAGDGDAGPAAGP